MSVPAVAVWATLPPHPPGGAIRLCVRALGACSLTLRDGVINIKGRRERSAVHRSGGRGNRMPVLRRDPVVDCRAVICPERNERPSEIGAQTGRPPTLVYPFRPSHEVMTQPSPRLPHVVPAKYGSLPESMTRGSEAMVVWAMVTWQRCSSGAATSQLPAS